MKRLTRIAIVFALLILIVDSKTAFQAASQGVELCIKTVIPALFPFIVLSGFTLSAFNGKASRLLRFLGKLFGMPKKTEQLLIPALLGGYPVGAKCISEAYAMGMLSKDCSQKLLFFCSNAGPSFLFGILPLYFERRQAVWCIWLVQLLSIFSLSMLIHVPQTEAGQAVQSSSKDIFQSAIDAMAKICGWVILGKLLVAFCDRWFLWLLPREWKPAIVGCMELTNGCSLLDLIADERMRFVVCSGLLSFGGLCVFGQTKAIIGSLHIRYYCLGKIIQTVLSIVYAFMIVGGFGFIIPVLVGAYYITSLRKQNNSSISEAVAV